MPLKISSRIDLRWIPIFFGIAALMAQDRPTTPVSGTVIQVAGKRVTITVASTCAPQAGDRVELRTKVPGLDEPVQLAGTWLVLRTEGTTVQADTTDPAAGVPQAGNSAAIGCTGSVQTAVAAGGAAAPGAEAVPPPAAVTGLPPPTSSSIGTNAPSSGTLPAASIPAPTPPVPAFRVRHAHPSFRKVEFATATISLPPGAVAYREDGEDIRSEHNFSFSCAGLKGVKSGSVNRVERNSIKHLQYQKPTKLSIDAGKQLKQIFAENEVVQDVLQALKAHCGLK